MSSALVLALIKYISFCVAGASSAWGLLKETTRKDAAGKKVLTREGLVALVFIAGSVLLGTASYALETFIREQAALTELARVDEARRQGKLEAELRDQREAARVAGIKALQ
jgi:hypothetical protein